VASTSLVFFNQNIYQNEGKSCLPWDQNQLASFQLLALHAGVIWIAFPNQTQEPINSNARAESLPSLYELLALKSNLPMDLDQPQLGKALEMWLVGIKMM